jgi:predicted nucleic acid-binding protein
MYLVDTSIMVDLLRGSELAIEWFEGLGDEEIGLPGIVVLELLQGCRSKVEVRRLHSRLVKDFAILWPNRDDLQRAIDHYLKLMPESGIEIMDFLIGELAVGLDIPICTLNTKQFDPIPGVEVHRPYVVERTA